MCRKLICLVSFVLLLGLANNAPAEIPRDPNLVIYYSFDSVGAIVPDESGKGHHGTVCGDVSLVPSGIKWFGAARFEGTGGPTGYSYLDLNGPEFPVQDVPKSAITLAVWVKCQDTGGHQATLNARTLPPDNTWIVHAEIRRQGNYRWLLSAYGDYTIFDIQAGTAVWNEWAHYAGTYDQATGRAVLYINGEVVQQRSVANAPSIAGDWGAGARVGYNIDNARPFTGLMDELYLFTRALSQDELNVLLAAEGLPSEKATHPNPASGTELETTSTILEWLPGVYAVSNDVYFGNSFEDVNSGTGDTFKGNVTEAQFAVEDLAWGTTYYWRIDGVNPDEPNSPWKGDVWSFVLLPSTAWNPTPADGARWIDPNAELSWSPGHGAIMRYVYFGDNFDDVNDDTGAPPQIATTFTPPSPLEFEKAYYWRVDESDGPTIRKGKVWSFTIMGADSGLKGEYYEDTALKALVLTRVDPGINFDWGTAAPDPEVPVDNFSVRWTGEFEVPFTSDWTFTASCDDCVRLWVNDRLLFDKWGEQKGVEWTGTMHLTAGQKYGIVMEYYENSSEAYAKLYWSTPSWLSPYQPKEIIPQGAFSLPIRARSPNPPSGAADVRQTSILTWSPGDAAVSHEVYFGTDADAVNNADTSAPEYRGNQDLDSRSYDPGELEWNTTYYWRVDEVEDGGTIQKGNLWSFTAADFLVVEDFESYTNDYEAGEAIWQTWIDGVENGTTSYVGYEVSENGTFGETTVVRSGLQSMPLKYSNALDPYYAETDRTWAAAQDWTINGIDTLTLHVQGSVDNSAAPLYVALEDAAGHVAVVGYGDETIAQSPDWIRWKIPLSRFAGVNPAAIKAMHIGVGDRDNPTPDGAGVIYIDDIWVTKPDAAQ